jgi:hypothetical protein
MIMRPAASHALILVVFLDGVAAVHQDYLPCDRRICYFGPSKSSFVVVLKTGDIYDAPSDSDSGRQKRKAQAAEIS